MTTETRLDIDKPPVARVAVKFRDPVSLPWEDAVERHIRARNLGPWDLLVRDFPGISLLRSVTNIQPEEFDDLVRRAEKSDPYYRAPNFLSYFGIPCPPNTDAEALARRLRTWEIVERAWVEIAPVGAAAPGPNNGELFRQLYLKPPTGTAPNCEGGIDALYAWSQCGDGDGQVIVSYERAMAVHQDITYPALPLAGKTDNSGLYSTPPGHGSAVLGIIAMQDNAVGGVGIAYRLADFQWASPFDGTPVPIRRDALWAAIKYLTRPSAVAYGRVLLFEVQIPSVADYSGSYYYGMPVEVYDDYYQAIRLATALGIVVIEAAGNGGEDLDIYLDATGVAVFDPHVRDSGAILIGACDPMTRRRWAGLGAATNFGLRVNCFAWGSGVYTTESNGSFTDYAPFGGTSAASAIVAGASLIVQTLVEKATGGRLSGLEMRQLLSDPTTGTPATDWPPGVQARIGVMPNLRATIDTSGFGSRPDVFMRDNLVDTGVPHTGPVSTSPDIIVLPSVGPQQDPPVADGQAAYGEGSGQEGNDAIGARVSTGRDHFVYVRLKNRGAVDAHNTVVTLYWSPAATLVTPDQWVLIGTTSPMIVPAGGALTVSAALRWPQNKLPGPGHYCFVGLAGADNDPQLDPVNIPAWLADWNVFFHLIRDNNNITWRNFDVLTASTAPGDLVVFEFIVPGAPDRDRPFVLEVDAHLPEGGRLWLEAPDELLYALRARSPFARVTTNGGLLSLPAHGRRRFGPGTLTAGTQHRVRLTADVRPERRRLGGEVSVRQLYEDVEVGRVTFRLATAKT
jgi:hypothetical protein